MARRNPMPLVVFNPPKGRTAAVSTMPGKAVSERDAWEAVSTAASALWNRANNADVVREYADKIRFIADEMRRQLSFGVHTNPGGGKIIARHVQAIAYIHAKDGDAYVHGFGNHDPDEGDLKDGWLNLGELKTVTNVEAFYNDDGSVTLRHKHGKKLVELFPD